MDIKGDDEEDNTTSKTLTWKLDDTNDEDGYKLDIKGAEDLEEGDVIEITYTVASDDGDQLVTGNVSKVEADTHELDKVSTKNNLVLTFDGETMELAQNKEVGDTIVPANPSKRSWAPSSISGPIATASSFTLTTLLIPPTT